MESRRARAGGRYHSIGRKGCFRRSRRLLRMAQRDGVAGSETGAFDLMRDADFCADIL